MLKLLGVPFDENSSYLKGPAEAPPIIRLMDKNGSANQFSESGISISPNVNYSDIGDMVFNDNVSENAFKEIYNNVRTIIKSGDKLITLGGDHSISFPIIQAHTEIYPQLNVLHIDAHADLYKDFEGNPYSHASPFARLMEKGKLNSLTQVGIRTLNTHQKEQAEKYNVKIIEMKNYTLEFINNLEAPLYISLDLDVLDPAFAPGVSHHEPGGMNTRQLIHLIQQIKAPIIGADIVEYNPKRDINQMTAMVAYKMFKELSAKML